MKISLENISRSKVAAGVEISFPPDGNPVINAVVLKKNSKGIHIENQYNTLNSIEDVIESIGTQIPVILLLNGKGVLSKKVSYSTSDDLKTLLNKVLPNASPADLNIQLKKENDSEIIISIIRSSILNDLLKTFQKAGVHTITECYLGTLPATNILGKEDERSNAASAALRYFENAEAGVLDNIELNVLKNEYSQQQKFKTKGLALLTVTFFILILNYFVFDNYWRKNNELNAKFELNQGSLKKYESLKAEYERKKEFLEQNGLLENAQTSFYADRLAALLPESITWLALNIHPLKKKINEDTEDSYHFENKSITVEGKCSQSAQLNDWMKKVRKLEWIEDISLLNYSQDGEKNEGIFLIGIKLK